MADVDRRRKNASAAFDSLTTFPFSDENFPHAIDSPAPDGASRKVARRDPPYAPPR